MKSKGPRTLHTKLQKMQLLSIHTTTFFTTVILYEQQFFSPNFLKNLCSFVCTVQGRDVVCTKFGRLPVNNSEEVERSRWQAYTRTHVFDESRWRANRNVQNFAISRNR